MAGFNSMFVLGTPGGFMGADGANSIGMLILVGDGNRQWLEPRYFDESLAEGAQVKKIIPCGGCDPNALLDALIAFAPSLFVDCPSYAEVMQGLEGVDRIEFDSREIPKGWVELRDEARSIAAGLSLWEAQLKPIEMKASDEVVHPKLKHQELSIEVPSDSVLAVHCLVCGHAVHKPGETPDDYWIFDPCPHLAFTYVDIAGMYEHQSEDFLKRLEQFDEDELDDMDPQEQWEAAGYGDALVVIEIASGGMACGPIGSAAYYGFDFSSVME